MRLIRSISLVCLLALLIPSRADATDLITPTDDAPLYELSNFRMERNNLGNLQLAIDFKRTRKGKGSIFVKGKSARGFLSIAAPVSTFHESGTMRLTGLSPNKANQPLDIELYFVQFHNWGEGMIRYAMVSNPVRLGNPGPPTQATAWTDEEKAAYENYLRVKSDDNAHKPAKSYPVTIDVPETSVLVPANARLIPGTRLEACWSGKWNPITTLSENDDGTLNVRWDDFGPDYDCSMARDELIIAREDLKQLGEFKINPFATRAARGSAAGGADAKPKPLKPYPVTIAVPKDSRVVPDDAALEHGTKLQACWAGKWNPITFLSDNADGSLTVRWDDFGAAYDCRMLRDELIINKDVLKESKLSKARPSSSQARESRTWTDASGEFTLKGRLVGKTESKVVLLAEDGREVSAPIADLSEADRKFIAAAKYE